MKHFITFFLSGMVALFLVANLFAQWEPDVRLTYDDSTSHTSVNNAWCVASDGDTVHVVWYDNRNGNWEIYYKRSPDEGTTWEPDARLTDDVASSERPCIAVSGSYVHVVWYDERDADYEIYYKHSTDGGTNWGTDTRLTNYPDWSGYPSLSASGSDVYVVWNDSRDGADEIYYKRSTNGGSAWGTDIRLTDAPGDCWHPSVKTSGLYVHVTWTDNRDGNTETYYKRSTDGGTTWEPDVRLTDDPAESWCSSVEVSASNVHVVWYDERGGNYEIYYKRSTDGGVNWGTDLRLSDVSNNSTGPSVAVSGNNVHVVWCDFRDGNGEIYYKLSSDGGTTWAVDTRLTDDSAGSIRPSVAVSGSDLHLVWYDWRDGNDEIYYKRNPTGNAVAEEASNYQFSISNYQLSIYPNPFTTTTTVTLYLPSIGQSAEGRGQRAESIGQREKGTELKIYDVSGRIVKSFSLPTAYSLLPTGVTWDGKDNEGKVLLPGVYFVKLTSGDFTAVKKVILVR